MDERSNSKRYKNIFVLSAGRTGSQTFANACSNMENYTAGHESRIGLSLKEKILYPEYHVESDNRLSWMLGAISERYPDAFYVHLVRKPEKVSASYNRRWHIKNGIMPAYNQNILMRSVKDNNANACLDYVACVDQNIKCFLRERPHITIDIDDPKSDFELFWRMVGASGNIDAAHQALLSVSNKASNNRNLYRKIKYFLSCRLGLLEEWLRQVLK